MSPAFNGQWKSCSVTMIDPTGRKRMSVVMLPDWVNAMRFVHLAKSLTCCTHAEVLDSATPDTHGNCSQDHPTGD